MTTPADPARALLQRLREELRGQPSIILFDGQPYKVIPTELADKLEQLTAGSPEPAKDHDAKLDIEAFCNDLVQDARVDGEVISLFIPRVVLTLQVYGLLPVAALTESDIQRTHELAEQFGWKRTDPTPSVDALLVAGGGLQEMNDDDETKHD